MGIWFIDGETGVRHEVEASKDALSAAWEKGWMPASDKDFLDAAAIDEREEA